MGTLPHWVANVQQSANAQRQQLPGESQAELAYRMARSWFDDLINATKKASPKTATAMIVWWLGQRQQGLLLWLQAWDMGLEHDAR